VNLLDIREVPQSLLLMAGGALGWLAKAWFNWARTRKQVNAQTEVTLGGGWAKLHEALNKDIDRLRTEMTERDRLCDERMTAMEAGLRADFAEQTLKLRSVIYSLAKKMPLDAKQQAILASIAPEPPTP
jgi:hypothetical protein